MKNLSIDEKYGLDELAAELGLSRVLENSLRMNFGDPISIRELKEISPTQFFACRNLGRKRWDQLQDALSVFDFPERSVKFIDKKGLQRIIIEVDLSKSLRDVIRDLSLLIDNKG